MIHLKIKKMAMYVVHAVKNKIMYLYLYNEI
jgi:hypothetical protein